MATAVATRGGVGRDGRASALPALAALPFALIGAVFALIASGNPLYAVAPLAGVLIFSVICVVPARWTLIAMVFLSLTLDATDEGPWNSPLAPIGSLLMLNLNQSIPLRFLAVPGIVLIMLALLALLVSRRLGTSRPAKAAEIPPPLWVGLAASLVTVLAFCALGIYRGGDSQMARIQVQTFITLLLMVVVACMSLRDVRDYRALGHAVLAAAGLRALYVLWAAHVLSADGHPVPVAATHGDSLLFAIATVLIVVRYFERPSARIALWCVLLVPLFGAGMLANNRRLAWVEVVAGLITFAVMSRRSKVKRFMTGALLAMLPVFLVYVAAGWNSKASVFAPVRMFRSVGDADVDGSTKYRDVENYNLIYTMRIRPMTGLGFGQPFAEIVKLEDISFFREYRYLPHNSILGLWAFAGPFGFGGIFAALVVSVYLAGRSYQLARSTEERTAAFMTMAVTAIYLVHCWGDMGFSERRTILLVGPALAIACQLACATGAWRTRKTQAPGALARVPRVA